MEESRDLHSYDKAVNYVKSKIADGEFAIGSRLPSERTLALELNIGRYSVREAMRVMEDMGIVESRRGNGNYISCNFRESLLRFVSMFILLRKPDMASISGLRKCLEGEALISFMKKAGQEDIQKLKELVEGMKTGEEKQRAEADNRFHQYIAENAQNQLLSDVIYVLSEATERAIGCVWSNTKAVESESLFSVHESMLEAIELNDEQKARAAVSAHYDIVEKIFKDREETL